MSLRRLRAGLALARLVVPAARDKKAEAELRDLMSVLSRFRDLQVQQYLLAHLPGIKEVGSGIRNELAYLEFKSQPEVIARLKSFPLRKLHQRMETLAAILGSCPQSPFFIGRSEERVVCFLGQAHDELLRLVSMVEPQRPKTIHRLRVAFKKYRYLAEALSPLRLYPDEAGMARMHELQGLMGEIQDLYVLQKFVSGWAARSGELPLADRISSLIQNILTEKISFLLPQLGRIEDFRLWLKKSKIDGPDRSSAGQG